MTSAPRHPSKRPQIARLSVFDLAGVLHAGWRDFRRAPLFGLFFSAVYVLGGFGLTVAGAGALAWTLVLSLGFPLLAPFAAVGLYEVSRRIASGEALRWPDILGVVWNERGRQVPWIGAILVIVFLFWSFFAHMSFALFLGRATLINITTSFEALYSGDGLIMLAFQVVVGAFVALLVFAITVVSMPLLLDREFDFVTAMLISIRTFRQNQAVLLVWAVFIAVALLVGMAPFFLGLLVVLPTLGHATWHLYKRALIFDAPPVR
ncbi:MAG: DUF2189 domain-containing protein [Pseudomonadota bacterium]